MENNLELVVSELAMEDLENIFKYISLNLDNPFAAEKLIEDFYISFEKIKLFPFSCPIKEIKFVKDKAIRVLIVDKYLAFYKVEKSKIVILRVKHSTSDNLV